LGNISCTDRAEQLLACCFAGGRWPDELLDELMAPECSDALFRIVVERLADLFEPRLCDTYAQLFSQVIERAIPELKARELLDRYQRIRKVRAFAGAESSKTPAQVRTVFVLSRVTLGADVAVTSVLLDAAKQRFPDARVVLVGSVKAWELFAGDPRVEHAPFTYLRTGSVAERLEPWSELKRLLSEPDSIVIDPDSRLTQLGLLPVCSEDAYFLFESRTYGGASDTALPVLAEQWARETFGVESARPYIAPAEAATKLIAVPGRPFVAMSLGVGENPAKRIPDPFEEQLLADIAKRGAYVLIDQGAGGEEAERVERAILKSGADPSNLPRTPGRVRSFRGSFAAFAGAIARSDFYVGYDSAGQHVAAACGVPLVSIFAGAPSSRFFARWQPSGKGKIQVVRVERPDGAVVLEEVLERLARLGLG
jgi:ADP-heptose:LPS heptosyltransferase